MALGLVVAAPGSGSGKTTVTLGLLRHLRGRGSAVQGELAAGGADPLARDREQTAHVEVQPPGESGPEPDQADAPPRNRTLSPPGLLEPLRQRQHAVVGAECHERAAGPERLLDRAEEDTQVGVEAQQGVHGLATLRTVAVTDAIGRRQADRQQVGGRVLPEPLVPKQLERELERDLVEERRRGEPLHEGLEVPVADRVRAGTAVVGRLPRVVVRPHALERLRVEIGPVVGRAGQEAFGRARAVEAIHPLRQRLAVVATRREGRLPLPRDPVDAVRMLSRQGDCGAVLRRYAEHAALRAGRLHPVAERVDPQLPRRSTRAAAEDAGVLGVVLDAVDRPTALPVDVAVARHTRGAGVAPGRQADVAGAGGGAGEVEHALGVDPTLACQAAQATGELRVEPVAPQLVDCDQQHQAGKLRVRVRSGGWLGCRGCVRAQQRNE